jgi:hypothetical protein
MTDTNAQVVPTRAGPSFGVGRWRDQQPVPYWRILQSGHRPEKQGEDGDAVGSHATRACSQRPGRRAKFGYGPRIAHLSDPLLTWCSAVTGPLGHGIEPGTQGFTIDRPDRHLMVRHHLETLQTVTAG